MVTPITTNITTTPKTLETNADTKNTNWPLIIGCVVGGVGFIALVGFLVFYAIKVQRRKALATKYED